MYFIRPDLKSIFLAEKITKAGLYLKLRPYFGWIIWF